MFGGLAASGCREKIRQLPGKCEESEDREVEGG
jgi:hypothetical protein